VVGRVDFPLRGSCSDSGEFLLSVLYNTESIELLQKK
jgi:hypothetical protein